MKTSRKTTLLLAALIGSASLGLAKDKLAVNVSDLTPAARKAVTEASKIHGTVKSIQQKTVDGRTVYDVEFDRNNAINPTLRIAADGTVVKPTTVATAVSSDGSLVLPVTEDGMPGYQQSLTMEELPAAVRTTIERLAEGREVADVDRESWGNRTVYEVEFREKGRNPQVHIEEDGSVAKDPHKKRSLVDWMKGTQLSDTPSAVQATIAREAQGQEIVDIDREGRKNEPVYEVEIRGADRKTFELHIAAEGSILTDSRRNSTVTPK